MLTKKRRTVVNFLISNIAFVLILNKYIKVPAGDMVVIIYNLIFGIIQALIISVVEKIVYKEINFYNLLIILLFQVICIIIVSYFGFLIRNSI